MSDTITAEKCACDFSGASWKLSDRLAPPTKECAYHAELRAALEAAQARIVLSYVSFLEEFCNELERGTCMLDDFDPSLIQRLKKALEGEAR